jgi:ElaB/YqjD/DUF883 family membrane-anchored ribosome-binding protein
VSTIANGTGMDADSPDDRAGSHGAPSSERLAEHAHDTVDEAASGAAEVERDLRGVAADAAERFRRSEAELADMLDENLRKVRMYIEKNPIQSAGIAFAAGVVLSSLFRR